MHGTVCPSGSGRAPWATSSCGGGGGLVREADFREADFREADFREADFREADFREADFREADFREADFGSEGTMSAAQRDEQGDAQDTPQADTQSVAPPPARRLVAVIALVPVIVALALWAFAWPAARIAPRDLPVGLAGPAAATAPLQQWFEEREGAFDVHRYDDAAAARTAIEDRLVYGAVVATPKGPELLTASAASPVVAQLLREAVTAQAPPGTRVKVTDVVAAPAADPRGSALGASVLPLAITGVATRAVNPGAAHSGADPCPAPPPSPVS